MKKLTLLLSAAVALAAGSSAMASQHSQDLIVDGTIQSVCTLTVGPQNVIALENNSWQTVADIAGACNNGSQHVRVTYLFTDFNDGDNFAKFKHNNAALNEFVGYKARVLTNAGVTPVIGNPYTNNQGNGVAYALQFEPQGSSANVAGNYTTQLTVSVMP
ncbi:MAG: hypothetical protein JJU03_00880 [Idiomarina sp.]|nr:hypothetical protein [Idiomarina sp.]